MTCVIGVSAIAELDVRDRAQADPDDVAGQSRHGLKAVLRSFEPFGWRAIAGMRREADAPQITENVTQYIRLFSPPPPGPRICGYYSPDTTGATPANYNKMAATRYTFGEIELDPAGYGLRRQSMAVPVEPRVLELLVYLVQHRDRVVTKEELLEKLWPQKYITESVLTRAIYEARRAIDDDSREQSFIKTVHSRGYQFVGQVQEANGNGHAPAVPAAIATEPVAAVSAVAAPAASHGNGESPAESPAAQDGSRTSRHRRRLIVGALSLAMLALLAAGAWFWRSAQGPARERIAIAPFGIEGEVQDLAWGELALPRLVADVMNERSDVVVFPANRVRSSLRQKGVAADAPEAEQVRALRDVFGVDHVLFGRIGRENGQVRVDYQLVNAEGEQRAGHALGDGPGSLTTQIAEQVAREMHVAYAAGIPVRKIAANEFTNEAFARGLNALLGGQLADALRYFETCLASAPDNGWARYEAGNVLSMLGHWDDASSSFTQAQRQAQSDGDRNLSGVAASGQGTLAWRRGKLEEAEKFFKVAQVEFTAANRRANLASALGNLGILADNRGDFDLARERYETALALYRDEGERAGESAVYSNLAVIERKLGRLDSAAQFQQRAIELQRQVGLREMLVFSLSNLGEIERGLGRWQAARPVLDEAVTLGVDTGYKVGEAEALTARGALAMDLGDRDAALRDLRAARAIYANLDNPAGDIRSALQLSALLETTDAGEARQLAQHALTVAQRIDDEALALESQIVLLELGVGDAAPLLPRLQTLGNHRLLALNWAVRARRENAPAHLRTALAHAESANDPRLQAELAVELARMLVIHGETKGIEPLLGRASVWKPDYAPAAAVRACILAGENRLADARRLLAGARTAAGDAGIAWCPDWP